MFKRFTAAIVALVLGVALSLVGSTAAQAQLLSQSVAAPCTPSAATTIHHVAVSHIDYQRYSYNPKSDHPDNPNDANPASTPVSDPNHWTANTTNYAGAGHGTDPIGSTFVVGKGNDTDNGSWFYWTVTTVIDHDAYDEVVPAVTCSDATISGSSLSAICDGTPVYTEAQFAIVNATWDTAIDNTVGMHTRGATATAGQLFASTTSNKASLSYTVPASLGTTQSTDSEVACYVAPSTVTYDTIVWSMPSPNTGTNATYPQVGVSQNKDETVQTLDVAVPTTCGTQYQVDVYVQTNGETDNMAALNTMFAAGLAGPDGAQDGAYLAGQSGNPGVGGPGNAWKLVKNADCVTPPPTRTYTTTDNGQIDCSTDGSGGGSYVVTTHYFIQTAVVDSTTGGYTFDNGPVASNGADTTQTVAAYSGSCPSLSPVSAGDPTNTNETCSASGLVGGVITVVVAPNVNYVITSPAHGVVSFNVTTGKTGPLANGTYTVAVTAANGYRLTSEASYSLNIAAHTGTCTQLVDHPLVTPIVTSSQLGCTTDGSYTLSNDLTAAHDLTAAIAVIWSVDGSLVSAGTFQVTSAGTVNVHAAPNGPNYGFGDGQQQDFTLTFARTASCELKTLALHDGTLASTGTNPTGLLVLAGFLALFGLALMRKARRLS